MKRPCPACKQMVDDGLACPKGVDPEQLKKSHKYCPSCSKQLDKELTEWLNNNKEKAK